MNILYLAVGGALGTLARFGMSGWVQARAGLFPWGTFSVNVAGALFVGFLFRYLQDVSAATAWRVFLGIGFAGAFTTFSTLAFETVGLFQEGAWRAAAGYALGSLVAGVVAVLAGAAAAAVLLRTGG